jgi:hypothetical protein
MPPRRASGRHGQGAGAQSRDPGGARQGPHRPCRPGHGQGVPGRRGRAGPRGRHDDPDSPSSTATAGPCNPSNQQAATHKVTACSTFRCGRGRRAACSLTLEDPASSTSARIGQVPVWLGPAGDCRGVVSLRMTMSNGSSWCPLYSVRVHGFGDCSSVGKPVTRLCQPADPRPSLSRSCCSWAVPGLRSGCWVNTTRPRRSRPGP